MDAALSKNGARVLRVFFALVVVFLYAPIVILLIFSFNKSAVPSFPLSGFTLHWYYEFLVNGDLRGALETSAIVAALSSLGAVALGVPRSLLTVVIGHIVITLPYTILVIVPRLDQVDVDFEEAAADLGAGPLQTFRLITLPLILPAIVSAFLIAFTTSFDEYAVASFVVGSRLTFPIYLYSALRFPSQLPQVIAVAVVVIVLSLTIVIAAELGRRIAERRLERAPS